METGLYLARNRYYDAGLSTFISRDPIESTSNLYAYCGDGPTNATDSMGLADQVGYVYYIKGNSSP